MSPKRIYIGGLTPDISQDDVAGRFRPFGEVLSCEIIKSKAVGADPDSCRGFAYVSMQPKDDASLARMLSLYNGCKWRGQKLRVEVAKPDYLTRLQQEQQQQEQQEQQEQEQQQQQDQAQQQAAEQAVAAAAEERHILQLSIPGSKRKRLAVDLTAKSKSHRCWFPTHKMQRPHELDWEPLQPSRRAALQAAADACVPRLDAATAAEQLRATQELLQRIAEQTAQQQRLVVVPQDQAAGVAVAFSYQDQQQPQQQQQGAKKGSSHVVEQELLSQLKLLKRISQREHLQQQQQGAGRSSSRSRAVVEFLDADSDQEAPLIPQQQQQQQQQQRGSRGPAAVKPSAGLAGGESDVSDVSDMSDLSSDYESDQWEQWLAAEGLDADAAADGDGGNAAADGSGDSSSGDDEGPVNKRARGLNQQQQQQQQQRQQSKQPAQQPKLAAVRGPSKQAQPAAAAVKAPSPAAISKAVSGKPATAAAPPPAAATAPTPAAAGRVAAEAWGLDKFGSSSESEEVLGDVTDSDREQDEGRGAAGQRGSGQRAAQRSKAGRRQSGDMLLCPVVQPGGRGLRLD